MSRLILASASPRRSELLSQIGLEFDVLPSDAEENPESTEPSMMVQELSKMKALDIFENLAAEERSRVVIGADTLVFCDDKVMGKPSDEQMAFEMLTQLAGNTHQVYTGVTLICQDSTDSQPKVKSFFEKTDVAMFPMSAAEIKAYIKTGEPMDKAGAYGIQGKCAAYIKGINGDYNNVVGLPIGRLYQELKKF